MPSLALWALSHTGPIGARGSPVSLSISPFGAAARQERKRVELVPPDSLQWTPPIALALCQSLSVRSLSRDALWRGMPSTAQSSSPRSLPLNDYGTPCGAPQGSTSSHMIDTSSRRDAGSVRADSRTTRGPAARERLWANHSQDAYSRRFSRKACCCSPGKNLKYREIELSRISGSPLSKCAPARKSAQIISRQYPRDLSVPSISAAVSIACSRS